MAYPLTFRVLHDYKDQPAGITVPVVLAMGKKSVKFFAKLDTGADVCIFKREHGEELGLDIGRAATTGLDRCGVLSRVWSRGIHFRAEFRV